jgi:hypothetical protein
MSIHTPANQVRVRRRSGVRFALPVPPFWFWSLGVSFWFAIGLLWPLPARLHTHTIDTGDALHLAWVVRWAQATLLGQAPPFAAPAGYPHTTALLFNPPLYAPALLGLPLHLAGWSPSAVYGALTILSFALAVWAVALLARAVSGSAVGGIVAGIGFAFSDIRLAHLAHLNLLSGFWTALLLWLVVRAWQRPPATNRRRTALALSAGVLAAAQALSDNYNALFMVVAIGCVGSVWSAALGRQIVRRQALRSDSLAALVALGGGALLALALVTPVLWPTLQAWRALEVARPWADHVQYAAAPGHYLLPSHPRSFYDLGPFQSDRNADPTEQRLWPGAITLALAMVGLLGGRGRLRWMFGGLSLIALVLSFGPALRVGEAHIELPFYRWLFEHTPLFSTARVPARWALLLQLGLAVLSAGGVARLLMVRLQRRWIARLVLPALIGLAVIDVRPAHLPTTAELVGEPAPSVYRVLAELPPGAVLEWPLENAAPTLVHRYQYATLFHGKPLVNSAGSAQSQRYVEFMAVLRSFPSATATRVLADLGVRYVVVNRWEIGVWSTLEPQLAAAPGITLLGEYDEGRHRLYAVHADQPPAPQPLAILSATPHGSRLDLHLAAPLWFAAHEKLYSGRQAQHVRVQYRGGSDATLRMALPPVLLPGRHQFDVPFAVHDADAIFLGDYQLPLARLAHPGSAGSDLPLTTAPLPHRIAAGETLPCLAQTTPELAPGLVLAATLIDADWREYAKRDHFIDMADGPLPCDLVVPTTTPAGSYFLALGIYDPTAGAFVPVIGADGIASPGFWRVPHVILIEGSI